MIRHLLIVSIEFRIAGLLIGLPSIAACVDFTRGAVAAFRLPPLEDGAPLDIGTYGLVALIANAARGAAGILHFLIGAAAWLFVALAVAAAASVVLGIGLYLTGRGIGRQAAWARVAGFLACLALALLCAAAIATLRRGPVLVALPPLGLSLYTLWVLVWRFS